MTAGIVDPSEAWRALSEDAGSLMIDVRTRAEWTFVGVPETPGGGRLALIEWLRFPDMSLNDRFLDAVARARDEAGASHLYFLCRSGHRSHDAAQEAQAYFDAAGGGVACFNVIEGFEGDLDAENRRGLRNGWKARGLPWRQN